MVERTQPTLFFMKHCCPFQILLKDLNAWHSSPEWACCLRGRNNGPYLMGLVTIVKTAKRKEKERKMKEAVKLLNHSFMQVWHQPYLFLDICQHPSQFRLSRWFFCYNFRSTLQLCGLWCNSFPQWKSSSILTLLPACNLIKDNISALIYS